MEVHLLLFSAAFIAQSGEEITQSVYAYNKKDAITFFKAYAENHDAQLIEDTVRFSNNTKTGEL